MLIIFAVSWVFLSYCSYHCLHCLHCLPELIDRVLFSTVWCSAADSHLIRGVGGRQPAQNLLFFVQNQLLSILWYSFSLPTVGKKLRLFEKIGIFMSKAIWWLSRNWLNNDDSSVLIVLTCAIVYFSIFKRWLVYTQI